MKRKTKKNDEAPKRNAPQRMRTKGPQMFVPAMKRTVASCSLAAAAVLLAVSAASAGEASTSASAGSNGFGPGTASATAGYTGGGRGVARTQTRSGRNVNFGQGIAYGVDRNGISFSASNALATRFGPALASTFNISINRNGRVSGSFGSSVAGGSRHRTATAGGFARTGRNVPSAGATAGGRTGRRGFVRASTRSFSRRRPFWR